MELLPTITNLLLAVAGFFLIALIISYMLSKFRKEKEEIVTASYPAEKYQYFSNSAASLAQPKYEDEYYYSVADTSAENQLLIPGNSLQNTFGYDQPYAINEGGESEETKSFQNNWVDFEDEQMFENPLRKTSSFNVYTENGINERLNGRMTIINEIPVLKYGWE